MTLHTLATGDTLVLSVCLALPSGPDTARLTSARHTADMGDITALEVFQVVTSNVPAHASPDALQVHIGLPAGFLAQEPERRAAVTQAQGVLAAALPGSVDLSAFYLRCFTGISRLASGGVQAPCAAYRYVLACDVAPEAEAELNRWYDDEHLPGLASVPGVQQARRDLCRYDPPRYRACYDVDHPDIVGCEAWLAVRHTPWTTRMIPTMQGVQRTMLRRVATLGVLGDVPPPHRG